MKVGSLFSGYGGLDLAVGGDLAWYCEIEPAACKVMEAHYPGVPNLGDITQVDWAEVEPVDVITGGYPCQPFSNAGMRKGKKDERHLWPHVRDAISAIRPRIAVLENVRGHLTLGFADVLADLADMGWSARWGVVRAAEAGAPHNRARLFIAAINPGHDAGGTELREQSSESSERATESGCVGSVTDPEREGLQGLARSRMEWSGESAASGDDAADSEGGRRRAGTRSAADESGHGESGVVDDTRTSAADADGSGSEARQHPGHSRERIRIESVGSAASPADAGSERHGSGQRPAGLARVGGEAEGSRWQASAARQEPGAGSAEDAADASGVSQRASTLETGHRLVASVSGGSQPGSNSHWEHPNIGTNWGDYAPAINRWEQVLGRSAPAPTIQRNGRDRLNPVFVEWMMGLPEGWVTGHGLSASQELKMLGNGVVPQQAALALHLLGGVA